MAYTLLDLVQEILSAMDSDEVDSITDTVESMQVAHLIRGVYDDIMAEVDIPEHHTLFELNASGDAVKPTLMTVPSRIQQMYWMKYDMREDGDTLPDFRLVDYKELEDFLVWTRGFRNDPDHAGSFEHIVNGDSLTFLYKTNRHPQYFTSIDDHTLIFDTFDSDVDTTLQKTKTMCWGIGYPDFTLEDNFVPDLDTRQFAYLRNRAKTRAFAELKQAENVEAASNARLLRIRMQNTKRRVPTEPRQNLNRLPNYGRK